MAYIIDGKVHPMEDYQLTVEVSTLQWKKIPDRLIYISKGQRWRYEFHLDHKDYSDSGEDIAGWWYHYKHINSNRIHKILIIND